MPLKIFPTAMWKRKKKLVSVKLVLIIYFSPMYPKCYFDITKFQNSL